MNFETYVDLLCWRTEKHPDLRAFTYFKDGEIEEASLSYGELGIKARAIAALLQDYKLSGQRILLLYQPGLDFISAFAGCMYAGAIPVPAYPPELNRLEHTVRRLQSIIRDANCKTIITTTNILSMAKKLFSQMKNNDLEKIIWITSDNIDENLSKDWIFPQIDRESVAFLQYTSGSTSYPKGVMITHKNILYNEKMILSVIGHEENKDHMVCWVPFYHDMGLVGHLLQTLYTGAQTMIMPPIAFLQKPFRWLDMISKYRLTTTGGPNFAYDLCVRKITPEQRDTLDLSCWRNASNAAEPVSYHTAERFIRYFEPCGFRRSTFNPSYGLAEAAVLVTNSPINNRPFYITVKKSELEKSRIVEILPESGNDITLVSSGKTILDQKVIIVGPETRTACKPYEVGEIWIQGNNVAKGYWKRPEETEYTFNAYLETGEGSFLRSGDLGFMIDGHLFVTGRIKDLIIIRGRNLYPQDIEREIEKGREKHKEIRPGCNAVFSVEIDEMESLVVFQEVDETKAKNIFNPDEIIETIVETIAKEFEVRVNTVVLIRPGSLPKTSSGKVMRLACKKAFLTGLKDDAIQVVKQWTSSRKAPEIKVPELRGVISKEKIENWIKEWLSGELNIETDNIETDKPFTFYGVDSATSVTLVKALEDFLNCPLYETLLWDYQNIDLLSGFLAVKKSAKAKEKTMKMPGGKTCEPVAIIGMACRFPGNTNTPDDFWELLKNGVDAITEIPSERWNIEDFYSDDKTEPGKMYTRHGGFIKEADKFEPNFFGISPREAVTMDPQQRILLEVSWEALENAGIIPETLKGSKTGVFIGISGNDYSKFNIYSGNPELIDAYAGTGNTASIAAGRISYTLGLQGPNIPVDTACSSSLVSIHLAHESLNSGESDMVIAGGVNLILSPENTIYFCKLNALSEDGHCRSFDESANGYVRSEGCGIVILKRLSDAIDSGDNILAVIRNTEVNHDGNSNGLTAPNGLAQEKLIRTAVENAEIEPDNIGFVEAHGTGTGLGDPIEIRAMVSALCENRLEKNPLIIGSVKSNIGHTESAAGIASLIKTVLALKNKQIPPNIYFQKLNPQINYKNESFIIPISLTEWETDSGKRIAGVSSFGISGTNAHIILEEFKEKPIPVKNAEPPYFLTISAKNQESLRLLISSYQEFIPDKVSEYSVYDLCYSAALKRTHFDYRFACVTYSKLETLMALAEYQNSNTETKTVRKNNKVVFVFPGQGSQWLKMGRQLFENEKVFRNVIEKCDSEFRNHIEWSLIDLIENNEDESLLEDIDIVQPLLFALQIAIAELWISWGICPDSVIGHSMGEVGASYIAGSINLSDAAVLICARSKILKQKTGKGFMLFTELSQEKASEIISPYTDKVSVAVCNSPKTTVLSGDTDILTEISKKLEEDKIFSRRVKVNVASHSPQMDSLIPELRQVLKDIKPEKERIKIYSTVKGIVVSGEEQNTEYWVDNVREAVLFSKAINEAIKNDCNIFVEISPHPLLLPMIEEAFQNADKKCFAVPSLRRERNEKESLLKSLAELYCYGLNIDFSSLFKETGRFIQLPNYIWNKDRYWSEITNKKIKYSKKLDNGLPGDFFELPTGSYFSEMSLSTELLPDFCKSLETVIFPKVSFIDTSLTLISKNIGSDFVIRNLNFNQDLVLTEEETKAQLFFYPENSGYSLQFLSMVEESGKKSWITHAEGKIVNESIPEQTNEYYLSLVKNIQEKATKVIAPSEIYQEQDNYETRFRIIENIWVYGNTAVSKIKLPKKLANGEIYLVHLAMLDACLKSIYFLLPETDYYIDSINLVRAFARPNPELWSHVEVRKNSNGYLSDISLFDYKGRLLFEAKNAKLKQEGQDSFVPPEKTEDWFFETVWELQQLPPPVTDHAKPGKWIIFNEPEGTGENLIMLLEARNNKCISVLPGDHFQKTDSQTYVINPLEPGDFEKLFNDIQDTIYGMIHLWNISSENDYSDLNSFWNTGRNSIVSLLKSLGTKQKVKLWVVTNGCCTVEGDKTVSFIQAPAWGLGKVINYEFPEINCINIDLGAEPQAVEIQMLFEELYSENNEKNIALRNGNRLVERLVRYKSKPKTFPKLKEPSGFMGKVKNMFSSVEDGNLERALILPDATYLVTGGLGGLGLIFAKWLIEQGAKNLVLTGRTAESIPESLSSSKDVDIRVIKSDVSIENDVKKLFAEIEKMPPLKGIIHSAGIISDGSIINNDTQRFEKAMEGKALGALNLHKHTLKMKPDFFIMFSSMVSIIGLTGLSNYASANAFMDSLAYYRRLNGLPALSINWGPWSETGLAQHYDQKGQLELQGIESINIATGKDIFEKLLKEDTAQVCTVSINLKKLFSAYPEAVNLKLFSDMAIEQDIKLKREIIFKTWKSFKSSTEVEGKTPGKKIPQKLNVEIARKPESERTEVIKEIIIKEVSVILKLPASKIDDSTNLRDYGFDSLMAIELRNKIENNLGITLSANITVDYPTVKLLSEYLSRCF